MAVLRVVCKLSLRRLRSRSREITGMPDDANGDVRPFRATRGPCCYESGQPWLSAEAPNSALERHLRQLCDFQATVAVKQRGREVVLEQEAPHSDQTNPSLRRVFTAPIYKGRRGS